MSEPSQPLVTVAITSYERADLFRLCLESVCAQTHRELEIFVHDNSISDAIHDIVADIGDPRIVYERNSPNLSDVIILNHQKAFTPRNGKYHIVLSSDWTLVPEAIGAMVAKLEAEPRACAARAGHVQRDLGSGRDKPVAGKFENVKGARGDGELYDCRALIEAAFFTLTGVGIIYHTLLPSDLLRYTNLSKVYLHAGYEHQAGLELLMLKPWLAVLKAPLFVELIHPDRYQSGGYRAYEKFGEWVARARFFENSYPELLARDFNPFKLRAGLALGFLRCMFRHDERPAEAAAYVARYGSQILFSALLWPVYRPIAFVRWHLKQAGKRIKRRRRDRAGR
ncbi:glycosyltransferase family 2 protein [Oceanibacterium hippocampi]|uniref:Glycosyl transferase family 2 n=1 Tax=Oceanibacterium hippocampi TaxID=745714 RepID=A0A1Y5TG81_9PROT|nr:glycosyltransferase family 2 protein [Oceanibacterium hippocampi]SLN63137.1 Glycosyl transferase family 2 [Oceanibacterium hippocampi]